MVQPFETAGNIHLYTTPNVPGGEEELTLVMLWQAGVVKFYTLAGQWSMAQVQAGVVPAERIVDQWHYTNAAAVPTPGSRAHSR